MQAATPARLRKQNEQLAEWRSQQWTRRNQSSTWLISRARELDPHARFVRPPRPARCGWPLGRTTIRLHDGTAHIHGLEHCASPWACPICTPMIRTERGRDLRDAIRAWIGQGHGLILLTLTRPHTTDESLTHSLNTINTAWGKITGSHAWRALRQQDMFTHWVRSTEITWNPDHGWHAHLHVLLFTDDPTPSTTAIRTTVIGLWNDAMTALGEQRPSRRRGIDVTIIDQHPELIGDYLTKPPDHHNIASEITRGDNKHARKKNGINPFQLLDPSTRARIGEGTCKRLWIEYVESTRGRRSITWSRNLRASLLATREKTDEQIINANVNADDIIFLPPALYRRLKRQPTLLAAVLDKTSTGEIPLAIELANLA